LTKYCTMITIPKKLWHIWIGPKPAPKKWMDTWPDKHLDWDYKIIDNEYISKKKFYNQHLIDKYLTMHPYGYAGAADLIRYEILYEHGGFMPGADAICLENTDELWIEDSSICYTVFESETLRPGLVSPILASPPKHELLKFIIEDLHKINPDNLIGHPVYQVTGNGYLGRLLKNKTFSVKVFPSHFFIPLHYSSNIKDRYNGTDKVYADQCWGTTKQNYEQGV
jgi:mannosyltransferase OCH1-like enzyme